MRASRVSLGVMGIVALLGASGCTENRASVFIRQVPVPNPDEECFITADPSAGAYLGGTMDRAFAFRTSYHHGLLVGNQLVGRTSEDQLRPESARVNFFEVEVEVFDFDGTTLDSFVVPTSGFADPADGDTPGFGLIGVTMIAPSTLKIFDDRVTGEGLPRDRTVVARMFARGETTGSLEVETGTFDFPIRVCGTPGDAETTCIGCIVAEDQTAEPEPACSVGQDTAWDCRYGP